MNKTKILIICIALLSVTACNKAHKRFVEMCKEDPRAQEQGFDCDCQADIISAVLKKDEMDQLINFLDVEKQDRNKAIELGRDPKYTPMFQKIAGIGLAIHDKCSKPGTAAEPPKAQAPAAQAPAAQAPAPAAQPAPAKKAAPAAEPEPTEE